MKPTEFEEVSLEEYKAQAQAHWSDAPCGSNYARSELMSKEFFEEVEAHRYGISPWLLESIKSFNVRGKKVLEVGFGMGTDHLSLAREGGIMYGIDLSPRHAEICKRRLEVYGFGCGPSLGDAENMPFRDNTFDFVYSFGVVHHSPKTGKIISEIHRVLKPGGRCFVAVYHKNSICFWWTIFFYRYLLRQGFRKRTLKQELSLIEYPKNNENIYVKLFKRGEFARLFDGFSSRKSHIRQLLPIDIWFFSRFFAEPEKPTPFLTKVGSWFGWYVVVEAEK
ncbi:MAG: class I SAM-dependent methyltransferase [bacterium]